MDSLRHVFPTILKCNWISPIFLLILPALGVETSSSPKPPHMTSRSHQGEDCCQCILGVGKTEIFFSVGKLKVFHTLTPESVEILKRQFLSKETLDSTSLKLAQVLLYWLITSPSNMYMCWACYTCLHYLHTYLVKL